jgi:hypothetical protein
MEHKEMLELHRLWRYRKQRNAEKKRIRLEKQRISKLKDNK